LGQIWNQHHDRMAAAAAAAAMEKMDVVLIGDSITEHWNGTRSMGTRGPFPEYRAVFDEYFDRATGASLQGLALGSSGDTTNHLLWHLQHGLIPDSLRPRVWFLLIGTNNMGRDSCSKRSTLSGVLNVLDVMLATRPGTPVLVHGLLPRNDRWQGATAQDFSLGQYWINIQWINGELQRFCQLQEHCHYMEATHLFLRTDSVSGEEQVNDILMSDALHPNEQGYREWGPLIVEQVKRLTTASGDDP
jgi:lysophospholipase L1-like esterase